MKSQRMKRASTADSTRTIGTNPKQFTIRFVTPFSILLPETSKLGLHHLIIFSPRTSRTTP